MQAIFDGNNEMMVAKLSPSWPIEITWIIFKSFLTCREYNIFRLVSKGFKLFVKQIVESIGLNRIFIKKSFLHVLQKIINYASLHCHFSLLKWCQKFTKNFSVAYYNALSSGNKKTLNWLEQNQFSIKGSEINQLWSNAIDGGIHSITWMEERYPDKSEFLHELIWSAAFTGSIPSIKWLYNHNTMLVTEPLNGFSDAALAGNVHVLDWLFRRINKESSIHSPLCLIFNLSKTWLHNAGMGNNFHVIEWFLNVVSEEKKTNLICQPGLCGNLLSNIDYKINEMLSVSCEAASKYGHLDFLQKIHHLIPSVVVPSLVWASMNGNFAILKWAHKMGLLFEYEKNQNQQPAVIHTNINFELSSISLCQAAAVNCQFEVLEWLQNIGFKLEITDKMITNAIMHGNIQFLEYINISKYNFKNEPYLSNPSKIIQIPIQIHQFDTLLFLLKNGFRLEDTIYNHILSSVNYYAFEFLLSHGFIPPNNLLFLKNPDGTSLFQITDFYNIVKKNSFQKTLIFFINNKLDIIYNKEDVRYCAIAAKNGNLELLQILRNHLNCEWNVMTTTNAAKKGHLDLLKYSINNGCSFNCKMLEFAVKNGHLDIVQFIINENKILPQNSLLCDKASKYGHLNILQWLLNNGCDYSGKDIIKNAATHGHTHILKWLMNYNNDLKSLFLSIDGSVSLHAASAGHLKTLKWALKVKCPWHPDIFTEKNLFYRIQKWAFKNQYISTTGSNSGDGDVEWTTRVDRDEDEDIIIIDQHYFFHQPNTIECQNKKMQLQSFFSEENNKL